MREGFGDVAEAVFADGVRIANLEHRQWLHHQQQLVLVLVDSLDETPARRGRRGHRDTPHRVVLQREGLRRDAELEIRKIHRASRAERRLKVRDELLGVGQGHVAAKTEHGVRRQ